LHAWRRKWSTIKIRLLAGARLRAMEVAYRLHAGSHNSKVHLRAIASQRGAIRRQRRSRRCAPAGSYKAPRI
jgi:hypothetical protein